MKYAHVFALFLVFGFCTSCVGQNKPDLPKKKEHPKLIKNPGNGNVQCGLQDKAGNLWFGTSDSGLYKYDGKSFRQFLVDDGLNSNSINDILEDKDGRIWIGTKAGVCLYGI
jgi:ligand-binding sensor domain-containing protein